MDASGTTAGRSRAGSCAAPGSATGSGGGDRTVVVTGTSGTVAGMGTPLEESVGALLGFFGVASSGTYDLVRDAVAGECARLGIDAGVQELRWGRLAVGCAAPQAPLLRTHLQRLMEVVESAAPGTVQKITVRPCDRREDRR